MKKDIKRKFSPTNLNMDKFQIFVDIDPNNKGTILGAYIHNFAVVGGIIAPILTIFWACFFLKFPPILVGFIPCSLIVGILFGAFIGVVSFRIKYGFKD